MLTAAPERKAGLAIEAVADCEDNLIKETAFLEQWGWEQSERPETAACRPRSVSHRSGNSFMEPAGPGHCANHFLQAALLPH